MPNEDANDRVWEEREKGQISFLAGAQNLRKPFLVSLMEGSCFQRSTLRCRPLAAYGGVYLPKSPTQGPTTKD